MSVPLRWILFASLLFLGTAAPLEAVFVRETPRDMVNMRGMIPALGTCLVGIFLLCFIPSSPTAGAGQPEAAPTRPGRAPWVILFAYVLFLYATVPYGFEVVSIIVKRIGIGAFRGGVNGLGLVGGLLFLWYVVRQSRLRHRYIYLRLAAILAVYVYFFTVLEVPVKRIHFLEYSFLSFLTFRAFRPFVGPPGIYTWVTLAATVVGVGDEGIALFFPRRFAAVTDVVFDATGGVLGALVLKFILLKR